MASQQLLDVLDKISCLCNVQVTKAGLPGCLPPSGDLLYLR